MRGLLCVCLMACSEKAADSAQGKRQSEPAQNAKASSIHSRQDLPKLQQVTQSHLPLNEQADTFEFKYRNTSDPEADPILLLTTDSTALIRRNPPKTFVELSNPTTICVITERDALALNRQFTTVGLRFNANARDNSALGIDVGYREGNRTGNSYTRDQARVLLDAMIETVEGFAKDELVKFRDAVASP